MYATTYVCEKLFSTMKIVKTKFRSRLTDKYTFVINYDRQTLPSKETLRGHSDSSFRGEGYIQCCVGIRLCDMYSNQELAEIHFMYGKAYDNAALARRLYQERYPQQQCPDRKTFVRLHYRLCEYGKFNSPGLGRGRPRSTTPEVQEEILEAVNMTPSISTRRVALQVNVPHTTVWRLLKEYQLCAYHLQRVQACHQQNTLHELGSVSCLRYAEKSLATSDTTPLKMSAAVADETSGIKPTNRPRPLSPENESRSIDSGRESLHCIFSNLWFRITLIYIIYNI
ncbi:hypothetical protein ANN_24530 [Periplaneta americana]|uniref:DUF4817 domain-containing protein n=1 Tax=Periplaneta americana TaxID=6978 RepID=A0ABQ8S3J0_PERAM|nr:hypothetical protein ANN_24530 [Periplaneta americana]